MVDSDEEDDSNKLGRTLSTNKQSTGKALLLFHKNMSWLNWNEHGRFKIHQHGYSVTKSTTSLGQIS